MWLVNGFNIFFQDRNSFLVAWQLEISAKRFNLIVSMVVLQNDICIVLNIKFWVSTQYPLLDI